MSVYYGKHVWFVMNIITITHTYKVFLEFLKASRKCVLLDF